jgi:hypothetical protein
MRGVRSDRFSDHQSIIILRRWRLAIVVLAALVGVGIEAIEHSLSVDIDAYVIGLYAVVVPMLTWCLMSMLIRSIDRQLASEVELDLHQHLRFQVVDPDKAAALHDEKTPPALIDETTGVLVDQLLMGHSHTDSFRAGQTYYLIFENPGNLVQSGSKVSVLLGNAEVDHVDVR